MTRWPSLLVVALLALVGGPAVASAEAAPAVELHETAPPASETEPVEAEEEATAELGAPDDRTARRAPVAAPAPATAEARHPVRRPPR